MNIFILGGLLGIVIGGATAFCLIYPHSVVLAVLAVPVGTCVGFVASQIAAWLLLLPFQLLSCIIRFFDRR